MVDKDQIQPKMVDKQAKPAADDVHTEPERTARVARMSRVARMARVARLNRVTRYKF